MFVDKGQSIFSFFYDYDKLLECPDCSSCIKLLKDRLVINCKKCGYLKDLNSYGQVTSLWGRREGEAYGYKLYLRVPACGHELWAFNKEHLDYLAGYISSKNRRQMPNVNQSVASRVPNWMKSSKNRNQLINALIRLRKKLEQYESNASK
ncbi:hypothetical protein D3C71_730650 [compost metagenome]